MKNQSARARAEERWIDRDLFKDVHTRSWLREWEEIEERHERRMRALRIYRWVSIAAVAVTWAILWWSAIR
jgi:hypothetical protein